MLSPTNSPKCDEATSTLKSDSNYISKNDLIKVIDEHQETSQQKESDLKIKNIVHPNSESDVKESVCYDKTEDTDAEILIDGNEHKISSNKNELEEVIDDVFNAKKSEQGKIVEDKITEKSCNKMTDEPNFETNVETLKKKLSNSQVTNGNLVQAGLVMNRSEDTSSIIVATLDIPSDVFINPAPILDKSENDPDSNQSSSLALLAQYDTEDDSDDDVCEVPVAQTYQNRCVEIDSDSSTSDVKFLSEIRSSINLDSLDVDNEGEDEDDEDEGNIRSKRQPKVKGELHLEDLPPIEDLHITVPEEECIELGKIHSIVEQLVLVNALPGTVPLDLETVLFRDKGKRVLGEVFDVLGQVSNPLYCVRFNSNNEIKEKGIEVGQTVYVAPRTKHTQFVVLANLMKVRGSDASWENDVEPPPRFLDYSDDEEERSARRPNRKRQSSGGVTYTGRGSYTPRRPYRSSHCGRGEVRHPHHTQGNYNIVGNSWHSNFNQTSIFNKPQYHIRGHSRGGYVRPNLNSSPYQQPPQTNPGLVINPYAVYPPPFPPSHHYHQQPPPE